MEIQCRCGNVHLSITADPVAQMYCHCNDCRAAHGGAYVASSVYPASAVQVTRGQPSPIVVKHRQRFRCAACGTFLFNEIEEAGGLRAVNAFLLPKGAFTPQMHINCQDAVLPVVDNLPHFKGFPSSFGGSDETVDW